MLPNFSGKRVKNYERIVEDEVLRETANWPQGQEFETLETMTRLTLNAIMRATFGERADALDELRIVIPPLITLGSLMQRMPPFVRREYGSWSPGSKLAGYRRRFDAVIDELIAEARAGSGVGRSRRHARAAVAGPLRRRPADLGSPHRRRTAHARRRRSRDDRLAVGVGRRAVAAPPGRDDATHRGSRRRRIRPAAGHDLRSSARPADHRGLTAHHEDQGPGWASGFCPRTPP